ncbi:MAG TPA: aminotransferase class V-fold PLP-dependent enzyme [Nitrososphaeraceae archaeon]|nr:aminotransferase class V-fold PLP-dependent enzyme [Nitrososphaeraceae archaeon]
MTVYSSDESLDFVRTDFPLTKKKIYMNNGSVAPTPLSTIKAITDTFLKYSIEGPDSQTINEFITSLTKELRSRIADLINCESEEIIFTQSTTEGLNYVRNGINWKKGDSVVIRGGTHEHYANYLPWLQLSRDRGVDLIDLPIDDTGYFDIANLENAGRILKGSDKAKKKKKKTTPKLITLSHALYNNGAIMPVEEVGRIAKANDTLFCIDAAQTVGSIEIDVKRIGCDFMAFPAFKWICGPLGLGVLYCGKKAAESLKPQSIGSESATLSSDQKTLAYIDPPAKFQTGFRNFPALAGLEASVRYLLRLGMNNIRRKNMKVANELRGELAKMKDVMLYGPEDENLRTSIVSFSATDKESKTIVDRLGENEIIFAERDVGGGKKAVRASPHFFNTEEESIRSIEQIKNIVK